MGLFNKDKLSTTTIKSPQEVFTELLKVSSGAGYVREVKFDIFYQVIAFKGICDGVGTSTLVANTALALAKLGLTVCVIDSSVLSPVQDVLLKTNWRDVEMKNRKDWFDIMYTDESVLHQSKLHRDVSVLSFKGKKRDITDIMGTQDSDILVETAISVLHNKFDIILIDCCQETTQINAGCIQQAQKVIQVWSDTPHIISNIDMWITNNVILSCPLDKMRYVIINKYVSDIPVNFDDMLKQYRFFKLTSCSLSLDIARVNATGKPLWEFPSNSPDIVEFNNCIIDIVCHLLNITNEEDEPTDDKQKDKSKDKPKKEKKKLKGRGTFTSNDIMDGKVEGTLHHKFAKKQKEDELKGNKVCTTLQEADESLSTFDEPDNKPKTSNLNAYQIDTSSSAEVDNYMKDYQKSVEVEED